MLVAVVLFGCGPSGGPSGGADLETGSGDAGSLPASGEDAGTSDAGAPAPAVFEKRTHVGPTGSRAYWLFEPAGVTAAPRPLIVVLHGCTQTGDSAARAFGFNELAQTEGFWVAYPEQSTAANVSRCWNWTLASNQRRDSGEAGIIAGIAREVMGEKAVDPARVFVVGLSAGGAMSSIMGVTYPDLFAAIGVSAGCAYQDSAACLGGPSPASIEALGESGYQAMGERARTVPVLVIQGELDNVIVPAMAERVVQQWLWTNDFADDGAADGSVAKSRSGGLEGAVEGGHTYEVDTYRDASGVPLVERWLVHQMGHAWGGGNPQEPYTDPKAPDMTREALRFFLEHPMP